MRPIFAFLATFGISAVIWNPVNAAVAEPERTDDSGCMPVAKGDGARWLASCERSAEAGDGRAALLVGAFYWNGDGVTKDNATAVRWWKMADKEGAPQAAKRLGDEAFVRTVAEAKGRPEDVNPAVLDEAITWYQKALMVEPNQTERQQAQDRLNQLMKFRVSASTAADYSGHDLHGLVVFSDSPTGKQATVNLPDLDQILNDLSSHAGNYPPHFDTPEGRERAVSDTKALIGILNPLCNNPAPNPEILLRAGITNSIGFNLDIPDSYEKTNSIFQKLLSISLITHVQITHMEDSWETRRSPRTPFPTLKKLAGQESLTLILVSVRPI